MSRLYTIDTNIFIDVERSGDSSGLSSFLVTRTAFVVLSAVVAQELRAGARTERSAQRLESEVLDPFERRRRVIVPTYWAWKEAGRILSVLAGKGEAIRGGFANDVLLAMSCRESGVVLITRNLRDFERIARLRKFDFVPPWP